MMKSDIIIIGAGPGGYETAIYAARNGLSVTIFENRKPGGTCLNEGCIPTKCFCRNAEILDGIKDSAEYGVNDMAYTFDFGQVIERKNRIVAGLIEGVEFLLKNKLITFVKEAASLIDAHSVRSVSGEIYSCDHLIIATGSVSKNLPIPGNNLPGVLTSKEILDIEKVPENLCVIGAGVIGLEFASVFNSFGSKVTVLEYAKEILPNFDADISKRLKQALGKKGIEIVNSAAVEEIRENADRLSVKYGYKGENREVVADTVLMAVGRAANVESLNLDVAGIVYSSKGIVTDDNMETNISRVYAIGDVNGKCMLAHAATFQGRKVIDHILGKENTIRLDIIPSAVFTRPEAAMVGCTEDECKQQGRVYRSKKAMFRANGKALSMGEPEGICKIIADEDGVIIGCHMLGPHTADIIQEISALINRRTTVDELSSMIHAHPTLSEIVQECAREF
ncbi:dihydrolipoyl dehydrogenase [Coprobacter sp. LH1063]|uniref:Dihydrolipoyl dehydrogenase n=2 Tax=Coprobacter tertius TaxID=2944915 RepID=A0ABT1MI28_9BACT|nr:dihydrolipoyl dehydrogenase [Coprobacter tertius]